MCTCTHVVAVVNCCSCCYWLCLIILQPWPRLNSGGLLFSSFRAGITYGRTMKHDDISIPAAYIFVLSVLWCSFVVGIACLYNVSKLLIISSKDVEMNPGPVIYKICPGCENNVIHIKKKMCPCGHVFGKNLVRVVQRGILLLQLYHQSVLAPL